MNTHSSNLASAVQFAQSYFDKNSLKITSSQRKSLILKSGTDPFFIYETDTKRAYYWNGERLTLVTNDPGVCDINILRLASNVADTETVSIDGTVFEFDRAADGVNTGNIAITGHADDTPANASTAIANKINSMSALNFSAIRFSANEVIIVWKTPGAFGRACSEALAGANNAFASANFFGGKNPGAGVEHSVSRIPTAQEVATGTMHFLFDSPPTLLEAKVFVTSTPGVAKAWDGSVTISGNRLTIDNSGGVDWAITDTVRITVIQ